MLDVYRRPIWIQKFYTMIIIFKAGYEILRADHSFVIYYKFLFYQK